jgi:hypothetical protein
MEVHINWLAVILATLSTLIVGSLWYSPKTFAPTWEKLARLDPKNMANASRAIPLAVLCGFVTAYVLAHVTYLAHAFFGNSYLQDALTTAFWLWLGLTAARIVTQ